MIPVIAPVGKHFGPSATGDTTPPSAPTGVSLSARTTTTATLAYTEPGDADYDHCAAYVWDHATGTLSTTNPFTGALSGLSAGTRYSVSIIAEDTAGNRSAPSGMVTFVTKRSIAGTYSANVAFRTEEQASDQVSQDIDIDSDYHRVPVNLRGVSLRPIITITEVGQEVTLTSMQVSMQPLGRHD